MYSLANIPTNIALYGQPNVQQTESSGIIIPDDPWFGLLYQTVAVQYGSTHNESTISMDSGEMERIVMLSNAPLM